MHSRKKIRILISLCKVRVREPQGRFPSPHHREPSPVDRDLDYGDRQPDLQKLKERDRLALLLRVLDDDHVACRPQDREVAGNRAAGRERHQLGGAGAGLEDERLEEGDERDIGDELAEDDAGAQQQRDGSEHPAAHERLEETGLPDALHQDEHCGKEDERAPVDRPEDREPLRREEQHGKGGADRDQRQGHEHRSEKERRDHVHRGEQQDDRKGYSDEQRQPVIAGGSGPGSYSVGRNSDR